MYFVLTESEMIKRRDLETRIEEKRGQLDDLKIAVKSHWLQVIKGLFRFQEEKEGIQLCEIIL